MLGYTAWDEMEALFEDLTKRAEKEGVDYADFRFVSSQTENIQIRNGKLDFIKQDFDRGVGIRVIASGAWGFAATPDLSPSSLEKTLLRAIEIAHASALSSNEQVKLDSSEVCEGIYHSPCTLHPFDVSLDEKLNLLYQVNDIIRKSELIKSAISGLKFFHTDKFFFSTEGARIRQTIIESGAELKATAVKDGEVHTRSYPNSLGGSLAARGYEFIGGLDLIHGAETIRDEALLLLNADDCPSGEFDIIIDSSQLALQVHESCGHPTELDRALGTEISFAGGSFLSPDKLGNFQYGSEKVSIVADATIPGSIGSFGYDDEGVKAQKTDLIRDGIFVGYLSSRETAPKINRKSSGAMRASGWNRIPLIRMVNVNLEPGDANFDDLIADTKKGIYFVTNKSWSIDDLRLNFQFGTEIAWLIENGKITKPLKNALYTGITPRFWNSCDAVCDSNSWKIWGVANCGKGEPTQSMHVAHGTSPARFRNVEVGVKK